MGDDPNLTLLRHSAYISLDQSSRARFCDLANNIENWEDLVTKAESNALSVLLYTHLQNCGLDIPAPQKLTLKALSARHQRANRERTKALEEIIDVFTDNDIEVIVLKGMALLYCLYTEQSHRPMGDIDILVAREKAQLAQQYLREIGFSAGDRKDGYLYDHHHLPMATRVDNKLIVQVEIHHDALSGDAPGQMPFEAVYPNRNVLTVDGRLIATMGYEDMLNHLCHHTFEPCDNIKLGAIADIYGYATWYFQKINWDEFSKNNIFVTNTLRCLDFLTPLPIIIADQIGRPRCHTPSGVGKGFIPLSESLNTKNTFAQKLNKIFRPSQWWQHIYYTVPPENSLLPVKLVRHPFKIFAWISRRLIANLKSKLHYKN